MLIENQHPNNKSIMLAVLGMPNVGKSSAINYLLGMELSAVTHKPQTTRNRFNCVFTVDRTEVVLIDTPGLHSSNKEFNKRLNQQAKDASFGVDVNLILIDISELILPQFEQVSKSIGEKELGRTWVVFTKGDKVENSESLPLGEVIETVQENGSIPSVEKYFIVSSKTGENMHLLTGAICDAAMPGPHLYPNGEISNKNERFFVTEYIREQAFELLSEEVPYELTVVVDEYKDFRDKQSRKNIDSFISASILVNRPSQRAIVIGRKGSMIKEIGTRARKKIEVMVGGQVHLNLHVKVVPSWFKNNFILEEIGLPRAANSNRVWRARG